MKLKAWITDAPGGGCVMQILEQDGVNPEKLTNDVRVLNKPQVADEKVFIRGIVHDDDTTISHHETRTAQSVVEQITAGLAGHAEVREPKRGDLVMVSNYDIRNSVPRIFLHKIDGAAKPFICVDNGDEQKFNDGNLFDMSAWVAMKPLASEVRMTRDGDIYTWEA